MFVGFVCRFIGGCCDVGVSGGGFRFGGGGLEGCFVEGGWFCVVAGLFLCFFFGYGVLVLVCFFEKRVIVVVLIAIRVVIENVGFWVYIVCLFERRVLDGFRDGREGVWFCFRFVLCLGGEGIGVIRKVGCWKGF